MRYVYKILGSNGRSKSKLERAKVLATKLLKSINAALQIRNMIPKNIKRIIYVVLVVYQYGGGVACKTNWFAFFGTKYLSILVRTAQLMLVREVDVHL